MNKKNYKLHLVQLKGSVLNNWRYSDDRPEILYANVKNHRFIAYPLNIGASFIFETEDEDVVIVPSEWIAWCVPLEK